MDESSKHEFSDLLQVASNGDEKAADRLVALVYDDLRRLAGNYLVRESPGHSWDSSELVGEAYLKLIDQDRVDWQGKTHFIAIAARSMRRLLVDHARGKRREKRGGGRKAVDLSDHLKVSQRNSDDLIAVDEAIEKLAAIDPQQAKIVEMRFFGGMTMDEVAQVVGMSKRSVEREWTMIRAWLRNELEDEPERE